MERAADVEQQHQDIAARIKQCTDRKERVLLRPGEDASNIAASLRAELASSREAQEHRHEVSFGKFNVLHL